MKVRDLIKALTDHAMDSDVYIGKGCGPLERVSSEVTDRIFVVLEPGRPERKARGGR